MPITDARILIVESDPIVRHSLSDYLRECGYRVFEAIDTDEAVAILMVGGRPIDVVLCDVNSVGALDGFGLARWLRDKGLAAKIILSGTVAKAAKTAHDLCEDGPLMAKPYDHQLLFNRIKRLLAQRDRGEP
jgi:DNA-binding response OmpR family regulator